VTSTPAYASTTTNAATVVVSLPANAKLSIDGEATKATSATRTFQTPELEPGKTFKYTLKAEIPVGEKTEVVTREIHVRAGEETKVTLSLPEAPAVAAR